MRAEPGAHRNRKPRPKSGRGLQQPMTRDCPYIQSPQFTWPRGVPPSRWRNKNPQFPHRSPASSLAEFATPEEHAEPKRQSFKEGSRSLQLRCGSARTRVGDIERLSEGLVLSSFSILRGKNSFSILSSLTCFLICDFGAWICSCYEGERLALLLESIQG